MANKNTVSKQNEYSFSQVATADLPRSTFNRSHNAKTTFDSSFLVPILCDEVIPGDTHNLKMSTLVRLSTPAKPIMDNIYIDYHFFFVPYRLIWDNFVKMMGHQDDPGDSIDYTVPTLTPDAGGYPVGSLEDYFGLPTNVAGFEHSSLYHRAYNLIWNEWYRDENLQNSLQVNRADTGDTTGMYQLQKRGKRHDYFTSCLPFLQKGDPVTINIGTKARVATDAPYTTAGINGRLDVWSTTLGGRRAITTTGEAGYSDYFIRQSTSVGGYGSNDLYADLTSATGLSINALREACAIQRFLERDARGGTRYTELIKSHFGVTSSDSRLQRPEYLGGGSHPLSVEAVAQTSSSDATSPQGNLGAYGVSGGSNIGFTKSFEEHGLILGLVSARADMNYQGGLDRMFSRSTRYDFLFPEFANLGEQEVLNKELLCVGNSTDDNVFGYQERYAEYRYKKNHITGKMRSAYAGDTHTSLDVWHLSQQFSDSSNNRQVPALNSSFIEENPPISRVVNIPSEPEFIGDFYFQYSSARVLPTYSIPSLIPRL